MKIFMDNKRKVIEHNRQYVMDKIPFELGMNKYGDMVSFPEADYLCWGK